METPPRAVDQELVDAAMSLAETRFPSGPCVAAALRTKTGKIITGVFFQARADSASLCAETGAICEAHRLEEEVIASVCLYRESEASPFRVLPACGVCQERLAYWGLDVQIAVPGPGPGAPPWQSKSLRELRPFYWDEPSEK